MRKLNALTRKMQLSPKEVIFPAMMCDGSLDIITDSGYRRLTDAADEVKGYGMRGMCLVRRGKHPRSGKPSIHLIVKGASHTNTPQHREGGPAIPGQGPGPVPGPWPWALDPRPWWPFLGPSPWVPVPA